MPARSWSLCCTKWELVRQGAGQIVCKGLPIFTVRGYQVQKSRVRRAPVGHAEGQQKEPEGTFSKATASGLTLRRSRSPRSFGWNRRFLTYIVLSSLLLRKQHWFEFDIAPIHAICTNNFGTIRDTSSTKSMSSNSTSFIHMFHHARDHKNDTWCT